METVHKSEIAVKTASTLSRKGQLAALQQLKREGIKKHNLKQLALKNPVMIRERNQGKEGKMVLCGLCSAFLAARFFSRHRRNCQSNSTENAVPLPISMLKTVKADVSAEFRGEIMSKLREDEVGKLCIADQTILLVGSRLYEKLSRKPEKAGEVKKSVRTDMRRIASLYLHFKEVQEEKSNGVERESNIEARNSADEPVDQPANQVVNPVLDSSEILQRESFPTLEEAIDRYTTREMEGGIKAGLKMSLFYLLKSMAKIVKATYLVKNEDNKANEIDKFLQVLDLNQNIIFGDAVYTLNLNRQTKLRLPEELPKDEDVELLRNHTITRLQFLSADKSVVWNNREFSTLRDLAVSRLTLFNARRGGEPARLMISSWKAADEGTWIDQRTVARLPAIDQTLFKDMKVAYQSGKGNNHLVPVLIPVDTVAALKLLSDPVVRMAAGVLNSNEYLFPSTQNSSDHVSGWHAVNKVCMTAKVTDPTRLTATKMRHRISTIYAGMDVPENERHFFYSHMGHSADINADIYQTPLAVAEISKVGRCLQVMDKSSTGKYKKMHFYFVQRS